jgi:KDO2-lipid IV(A) lauroyltransferase
VISRDKVSSHLRRYIDYLVYLSVRLVEEALCVAPESWACAFGRFAGRVAYRAAPDRRDAVLENLRIAFGSEQSPKWIEDTARKSFEHLGLLGIEFIRIRRWSHQEMHERLEIEGADAFNLAMAPGADGILLLNSHFGCFEVSAATVKYLGMKTNLFATGLKNPFLSRYIATRAGWEAGIKTFPHRGSVKPLISTLQQGELVAVLADQRGDVERGVIVDYFGSPAPANEVFAKMAIEGRARILPLCTFRLGNGKYKSVFWEAEDLPLTGDTHEDLIRVSQIFHNFFEKWMRMYPEQGFWVQRKWKRKPSRRRKQSAHAS